MDIILAKFLGIYIFFVGLAMLANPSHFKKIYSDFFASEGLVVVGGIIALLFGAVIVSLHNVWVVSWPVIITIIGWWSVIKGAGLLIYPEFVQKLSKANWSQTTYRAIGLVWMALGALLSYAGWIEDLQ